MPLVSGPKKIYIFDSENFRSKNVPAIPGQVLKIEDKYNYCRNGKLKSKIFVDGKKLQLSFYLTSQRMIGSNKT